MGNFITTREGVNISLSIPAQITSFEEANAESGSHTTNGKLKVFSVGNTGDIREFSPEFSDDLVKSLPGCPVVAYYDTEEEDFKGHNFEQYVYGYVPEDAVPEFIEEDGKKWAVVDVKLFTERDDNIGNVAKQIIGKAQSLELNPDTVEYRLEYINNKLSKIKFLKGAFYGLSVLGDNQTPAFEGAGFFSADVIQKFKALRSNEVSELGGNKNMRKTDFMSLGIQDKLSYFTKMARTMFSESEYYAYVCDFNETQFIISVYEYETETNSYFAADYSWDAEDNYLIGEPYKVMPSYVKIENKTPSNLDGNAFEDNAESTDVPVETEELEDAAAPVVEDTPVAVEEEKSDFDTNATEPEVEEIEENSVESTDEVKPSSDKPQDVEEGTVFEDEQIDTNNDSSSQKEEKEEDMGGATQNASADFASLSSEERDELNALRKEKKLGLIRSFSEFLSEEVINDFIEHINEYNFAELEMQLKIKSFDTNRDKMNQDVQQFGIVLPTVSEQGNAQIGTGTLDRTVSLYLDR